MDLRATNIKKVNYMNTLQAQRQAKGLTQKQLAEKSGVPLKTIANYEINRRNIANAQAHIVLALADALEIDPHILIKE